MELLSIICSFKLINDFELNESTWKFDLRINHMHSAFLQVMIAVISHELLIVSVGFSVNHLS